MKRVLYAVVFVVLGLGLAIVWMAGGVQKPRTFEGRVRTTEHAASTSTTSLTVATWNFAWGYGWGSEGSGSRKNKDHFSRSLVDAAALLRTLNADVVLLQEVDFYAARSHYADQPFMLASLAGYRFVADAPSWEANHVPFPYWPPSDQFGRMNSGGAILSRFPIRSNSVDLFEKPRNNPFWYNLFYLFRFQQHARIDHPMGAVDVFNVHLEAFDSGARLIQAKAVARTLSTQTNAKTLVGGDFNTVPAASPVRSAYPDEPETNHENDRSLDELAKVSSISDVITAERFAENPAAYFTFPSHEPNRKLDYVFVGSGFRVTEARVATEAKTLSDHLPIVVRLELVP